MHEDEEGSSCRKDETACPFSNKPIMKHPVKKYFLKNQTWLGLLTKNKACQPARAHTRTRTSTRARQVLVRARAGTGQLCPPPHLLDSSPPPGTSAARHPGRKGARPPRGAPRPATRKPSAARSAPPPSPAPSPRPPPALEPPQRPLPPESLFPLTVLLGTWSQMPGPSYLPSAGGPARPGRTSPPQLSASRSPALRAPASSASAPGGGCAYHSDRRGRGRRRGRGAVPSTPGGQGCTKPSAEGWSRPREESGYVHTYPCGSGNAMGSAGPAQRRCVPRGGPKGVAFV